MKGYRYWQEQQLPGLTLPSQAAGRPAMSFYPPGPAFPAVAAVVNYRPPLPAAAAAAAVAAAAVPLAQPLVGPLPVPVPVLEPPRVKCDGASAPFSGAGPAAVADPVTKAVMDNIMGKLPTKKQPASCKCEVCGLEFSGQVVLETHLAGAKHAKKVKSQEILRQLQSSGQTFSRDEKTKILKCEVCDVVVNSSQQLQTHLAGNKHKQKALKKASQGGANKGPLSIGNNMVTQNSTPGNPPHPPGAMDTKGDGAGERPPPPPLAVGSGGPAGVLPPPPPLGAPLPPPLHDGSGDATKKPDGGALRASKYFCDTCNVSLNSEIQLEQHLGSRKHKERVANGGKTRPRPAPYWKKPRGPGFGSGGGSGGGPTMGVGVGVGVGGVVGRPGGIGGPGLGSGGGGGGGKPVGASVGPAGGGKFPGPSLSYPQPLSSTFVSGGSMM